MVKKLSPEWVSYLISAFEYNPDTGVIVKRPSSSDKAPLVIGAKASKRYHNTNIRKDGETIVITLYRLAWILHYKVCPTHPIACRNGVYNDMRIDNLYIPALESKPPRVRNKYSIDLRTLNVSPTTISKLQKDKNTDRKPLTMTPKLKLLIEAPIPKLEELKKGCCKYAQQDGTWCCEKVVEGESYCANHMLETRDRIGTIIWNERIFNPVRR